METFTKCDVHAVLVSESWLKPHLSTLYPLPGFILIRNDRIDKGGGGVAIYLRSDFPYKIIATSSPHYSASAEYLFLEVSVKGIKTLIGVVYCPPNVDYFTDFESVLESLGSEYAHHIIMGDFNTNLLAHNAPRSRKLLHIVESSSLHVLPLQATHHNTSGDDTWLDLIITSNPSLVSSYGQCSAPGFSHHDLIFLSYILKPPKPKPKVLHVRSFARLNVELLCKDAAEINWEPLLEANDLHSKVCFFNESVINLYDKHAPVTKVRLKRLPAPWMTRGIKMAMRRRDRTFRKYKRDRTEENWSLFKAARNRCNQMVRNAKRQHILKNISTSTPADIWKFLGTLGIGKSRHSDLPSTIALDDLNYHFSTTPPMDHQTKCQTISYINGLTRPIINSFKFSPVGLEEIKKIILSIKSNAVGCDLIGRRMILLILDHLLPAITHIVNFSLETGSFPSLWRKAIVRPLPKVSNPSCSAHYRPISILPFLSKVLESCVQKQLSRFVHTHNLISPLQSGFRPGHSTTTALLKVTGDIRAGMEDTMVTVMVLIDFSNAFNTVSHDILLSILSHLMISDEALGWFASYLRGRQQSVRVGECTSDWCNVDSGVPQGGILSPLLFSVFINLLTHNLQSAYHLYADDLQLYAQSSIDRLPDVIDGINRDLSLIKDWSDRFGLSVNPSKCQATIVGSSRTISRVDCENLAPILFNGSIIPISQNVKDLGLLIDSSLSWQYQIASVSKRVTGILRSLYRLKNFLPWKTKVTLVQALIFPIIDYGDVCYFDLNADHLNKLDRLLNNCIRFVFNLRKYDHVSSYRTQLQWLPIRQRRSLRALTTLYSILDSPSSPSYLTSHFQFLGINHNKNLRSTHNRLLHCPPHHTDFLHSSFFVQSILLWNALPLEIRMAKSRFSFKMKVKEHILKNL